MMNTATENRESSRPASLLGVVVVLLALSAAAYFAGHFFGDPARFRASLYFANFNGFELSSIAVLPVFFIATLVVQKIAQRSEQKPVFTLIAYLTTYIVLTAASVEGIFLLLSSVAIYFLFHWLGSRNRSIGIAIAAVLLYLPSLLFTVAPGAPLPFLILLFYKTCLMMRLYNWSTDRFVYRRTNFDSFEEYLEFLYCPIFFLIPGQIQYFRYQYFHENKRPYQGSLFRLFGLGLWGLLLMLVFSFMVRNLNSQLLHETGFVSQVGNRLYKGAFWLVAIYFQQTAGMSFQIALARALGYQFKYDMHYPFLARSPLDYLRRHSSYVRDYVVETAFRPFALFGLRRGWSSKVVFAVAALAAYAFLISPQTGYRADFLRPWTASFILIGLLGVYLVLPLSGSVSSSNIAGAIDAKPLRSWKLRDWLSWAFTLFILIAGKAIFDLAMTSQAHI